MSYAEPIVPRALNTDSPELERETAFFLKWGYLIVDNALTNYQVESLRAALDETFKRNNSEFTSALLEEDERFAFLLDNPPVISRIRAILGTCVQLHSATARVTHPGSQDQNWHRDGPWPMDPRGTPYGSLPGQVNCGYYLDELTPEKGPVMLLPGSHRAPFGPPEGHVHFPDELKFLSKPGQAILFDGWTFHRGSGNNTQSDRRVCLMCYQNAWMKSRETFDGPMATKLREEGSPERQLLLGGIRAW